MALKLRASTQMSRVKTLIPSQRNSLLLQVNYKQNNYITKVFTRRQEARLRLRGKLGWAAGDAGRYKHKTMFNAKIQENHS